MHRKNELDGKTLDIVFKQIGYMFACGSTMAAGALVFKYSEKMTSSIPLLSQISGIIIIFLGLGFSVWVGMYGFQELTKHYNNRIRAYIYGPVYLLLSVQIAMAGFFAITDQKQDQDKNQQHLTSSMNYNDHITRSSNRTKGAGSFFEQYTKKNCQHLLPFS
jgi:hypothetical protein